MSANGDEKESGMMSHCASCGVKEGDDIKLKICTACKSIRYCGVKCQKEHRSKHKRACKKRAAELRDEILFRQPESSCFGDCPICCLPHSLDGDESTAPIMSCCGKMICLGCCLGLGNAYLQTVKPDPKCPFCRQSPPKSEKEEDKRLTDRAEMNDLVAMCQAGMRRRREGYYKSAIEYWTKAAKLGDVQSHHQLALLYHHGEGVEKDISKAVYHYEQAAIGGHPLSRHNLGVIDKINGRYDRAVKHWIIAAKLGYVNAMKNVKFGCERGLVSKDDFAAALRGHQATVDATKSPQREEAAVLMRL